MNFGTFCWFLAPKLSWASPCLFDVVKSSAFSCPVLSGCSFVLVLLLLIPAVSVPREASTSVYTAALYSKLVVYQIRTAWGLYLIPGEHKIVLRIVCTYFGSSLVSMQRRSTDTAGLKAVTARPLFCASKSVNTSCRHIRREDTSIHNDSRNRIVFAPLALSKAKSQKPFFGANMRCRFGRKAKRQNLLQPRRRTMHVVWINEASLCSMRLHPTCPSAFISAVMRGASSSLSRVLWYT